MTLNVSAGIQATVKDTAERDAFMAAVKAFAADLRAKNPTVQAGGQSQPIPEQHQL